MVLIFRSGGGGGGGGGNGENRVVLWQAVPCACILAANLLEHRRPMLALNRGKSV